MRPIRVVVAVLCLAPLGASAALRGQPAYVDGEVLVKYRDAAGGAVVAKSRGLEVKRSIPKMGVDLLKLPSMTTVPQAIAMLKADPSVVYAEPNFRRFRRAVVPNDPLFGDQWGLRNTGQANFVSGGPAGIAGADLDMVHAWDADGDGVADRTGDPSVIVAVIDDGVLTTHEDLAANIVAGRDTRDDDNDPNPADIDEDFHGTLVAGCIGAVGDNGLGVAGVAWQSKLMPLRFDYDAASEAQAIQFAIDHGAQIINASFGGPGASLTERDAIQAAGDAGILFVSAAGNHDSNVDHAELDYPTNYELPNIITVAATNRQDEIASFSQYGPLTVDVAAPGLQVVTTAADGGYATAASRGVTGTSFSAPYVAGVASLLKAKFPTATPRELRARLIESAEPVENTGSLTVGGRVNADQALELAARPSIVVRSVEIDAAGNDSLDPGETATVHVVLENLWLDATHVTIDATATTVGDSPERALTVEGGPVTIATLGSGGTATADFTVRVPGALTGHHYVRFAFAITADGGYAATRHYADEVSNLPVDGDIDASFVGLDAALQDDFHAYHVTLDHDLVNEDLVIRTRANPDIDLLVKSGERPVYDIALGADPESDGAIFCTSGDTGDCQDDETAVSGNEDGFEAVRVLNAHAGTYHIVVTNFAQPAGPLPYTISASLEPPLDDGGGGGGGAIGAGTLAGLLGFGLLAAWTRRRAVRVSEGAVPR